MHLRDFPLLRVIDNLHNPIIVVIPDTRVPVTRYLVVQLRHGRGDGVRVQVTASWDVAETDNVAVLEEADLIVGVVGLFVPFGEDCPLVVVILVVVAGNLLLVGADGVSLDMRMQEATSPAHVLEGDLGAECDI